MRYGEGIPRHRPPPPGGASAIAWRRPERLARARQTVDRLLDSWSADPAAGRGRVSVELWPDPSAADLLLIARAAEEQPPGLARELTRDALALRSQAERTLLSYRGLTRLDTTVIEVVSGDVETLAAATHALECAMAGAGGAAAQDVAGVRALLGPARSKLASARVRLPMLRDLSVCVATGEPPCPTGLTEDETALLSRYTHGSPEMPGPYDRECLEACCLRLLLENHVTALEQSAHGGMPLDSGGFVDLGLYTEVGQGLRRLEERLAATPDEAARIGRFRESLLGTYQKLAGAEERAFRPAPKRKVAKPEPSNAYRRPRGPQRETHPRPRAVRVARPRHRRRRPRLHILVLLPIAVVLGVAFWLIPGGPPPRIETRLADYTGTVPLVAVAPVGTMLNAEVVPSWTSTAPEARLGQIEALATVALSQGFRLVRLVDGTGAGVGEWTTEGGARLLD